MGWNQADIAEVVGLDRTNVAKVNVHYKEILKTHINSYKQGKPIEKIASDNGFNIALAYAVVFSNEDDKKRLKAFSDTNSSILKL